MHGVVCRAFYRVKSNAQAHRARARISVNVGVFRNYILRIAVLVAAHIGVFGYVAVLVYGIAAHVEFIGICKRLYVNGVRAGSGDSRKRLRRRDDFAVFVFLHADIVHVAAVALLVRDVKVVGVGVIHGRPGERLRLLVQSEARGRIQLAGVVAGGESRKRTQRQTQNYNQCQNFLSHYSSRIYRLRCASVLF